MPSTRLRHVQPPHDKSDDEETRKMDPNLKTKTVSKLRQQTSFLQEQDVEKLKKDSNMLKSTEHSMEQICPTIVDWTGQEEDDLNFPIRLRNNSPRPQIDVPDPDELRKKEEGSRVPRPPKTRWTAWNMTVSSHKMEIVMMICFLLCLGIVFASQATPTSNNSPDKVIFCGICNNQAQEVLDRAKQLVTEVTPILDSLKGGENKFDRREEEDLDESGFERKKVYETGVKKGEDGESFEIYKSSSSRIEVHRQTSPLMADIEARKKKYRPDYKP